MQELLDLQGMVLKSSDYGEYARRIVLLSLERGKVTVFCQGAKKPGSRTMAATEPFVSGTFRVAKGRSAYNLREAKVNDYMEGLRTDYDALCFGTYFLEVADYYSRENNDDSRLLKLLYTSIKALLAGRLEKNLVRAVFEIKAVAVNGEFPYDAAGRLSLPGARHALEHILNSDPGALYAFSLREDAADELSAFAGWCRKNFMDRDFRSLELIE